MAFLFAAGILVTLIIIGIVTSFLGRIVGDAGPVVTYIVGGFLIFFGIYLTGLLPLNLFNFSINPSFLKQGLFPSFLFGLIFGLALGPCSFAFMAPMLAIGFQSARTNPFFAFFLLFFFAVGHCTVIVAAGILTEAVRSLIKWNEKTKIMDTAKKVFGFVIAAAGVFLIVRESVL
jgi:cytochrome c-type biogenesis protein